VSGYYRFLSFLPAWGCRFHLDSQPSGNYFTKLGVVVWLVVNQKHPYKGRARGCVTKKNDVEKMLLHKKTH